MLLQTAVKFHVENYLSSDPHSGVVENTALIESDGVSPEESF
jgi:hypothetical protein